MVKKHTVVKVMKIRSEEKHPKEKISENKFGYHTKSEVYANKGSDITELSEIGLRSGIEIWKGGMAYV